MALLEPHQIQLLEKLAQKGITDAEIAKTMGLNPHAVGQRTTKYWKRKMEEKNARD